MQVFWSWQADTPTQIGRAFIRAALEAALREVMKEANVRPLHIAEPSERDRSVGFVSGSDRPQLDHLDPTRELLDKINQSFACVVDVTPAVADPAGPTSRAQGSINADISIELGCALGVLGNRRTLLVMNEHYGDFADLPSHLQEKEYLLIYNLPPSADAQTISVATRRLVAQMVGFIQNTLNESQKPTADPDFERIGRQVDRLIFFSKILVVSIIGLITFRSALLSIGLPDIKLVNLDSYVWKLTFWTYFTSWILGVAFDLRRERDVFVSGIKDRGRIPWQDAALVFTIAIFFFTIAAVEQTHDENSDVFKLYVAWFGPAWPGQIKKFYDTYGSILFLTILNTLWLCNIFLWRYFLKQYIDQMVRDSGRIFRLHRYFVGQDKLHVLQAYIEGSWQDRRYLFGGIYLVCLDAYVAIWWTLYGLNSVTSKPIHFLAITAFIAIFETWVWIERAKMAGHLSSVDDVADRYWLIPRISVEEMNRSNHLARLAGHVLRRRGHR